MVFFQSYIVPRELRQVVAPPLCNLKELYLSISNKAESHPIAEFVDAMLWISPHLETLTIDISIIGIKSSFKVWNIAVNFYFLKKKINQVLLLLSYIYLSHISVNLWSKVNFWRTSILLQVSSCFLLAELLKECNNQASFL